MKATLTLLFFVVIFFYIAETKISTKPFSIKFNDLSGALGFLFLALAIGCLSYSANQKGRNEMYEQIIKEIKKQ